MSERAPLECAEVAARRLADRMSAEMPHGWGFALLLFSHGEHGAMTYISNLSREDVIAAVTEWLVKVKLRRPEL